MESNYGAWLDSVLDRYSDFIILLCAVFNLSFLSMFWIIVGFFAVVGTFMVSYTGDMCKKIHKKDFIYL